MKFVNKLVSWKRFIIIIQEVKKSIYAIKISLKILAFNSIDLQLITSFIA